MATNAGTIPRELAAFELASTLAERSRPRILLGDVHIDRVDLDGAVERIDSFLRSEKPHQVVTVNLDFLRIAEQNIRFRDAINSADLAVADGMPLVWLSRLLRQPLPQRVAGVDLVHESCALAARAGRGVFLLGGRQTPRPFASRPVTRACRSVPTRHPLDRCANASNSASWT